MKHACSISALDSTLYLNSKSSNINCIAVFIGYLFLAYIKVKNTIADKNIIGNIPSVIISFIKYFLSSLSIGYLFSLRQRY